MKILRHPMVGVATKTSAARNSDGEGDGRFLPSSSAA